MSSLRLAMLSLGLAAIASPLAAQAGSVTGLCGDGTTTSAKSKSGACSNHGGVKTWYGEAGAPAAPTKKTAPKAAAPAPAPAPPTAKPAAPKTVSKIPAGMTGKCGDGTFTAAKSKSGACSNHGGVAEWYGEAPAATAPKAAPPAPTAAPAAAPTPKAAPVTKPAPAPAAPKGGTTIPVKPIAGAPAAATALCNDGTYSESQHRSGSCSSHGGVKQWLKEIPPQD